MGSWFFVGLVALAGGMGVALSAVTSGEVSPGHAAQVQRRTEHHSRNAVVEQRRAFDYLARRFLAQYPDHLGPISLALMRERGILSDGVTGASSYPSSWTIGVAATGLEVCTPAATPQQQSALMAAGFVEASVLCGVALPQVDLPGGAAGAANTGAGARVR